MNIPIVSVVMSVRNGMPYLVEAANSILSQTLEDIEFIILDNASTDGSAEWAASLDDKRIRLICNEKDLGLSASLNRGFELARGEFIARMDADDISLPDRLMQQVVFMREHPDIAVCGGAVEVFGVSSYTWRFPTEHTSCLAALLFRVPLAHPAVMYRGDIIREKKLCYDEQLALTQDYEMWYKIAIVHKLKIMNIRNIILKYRSHNDQESNVHMQRLNEETYDIQRNILSLVMNSKPTNNQLRLHAICSGRSNIYSVKEFIECIDWLSVLPSFILPHHDICMIQLAEESKNSWKRLCAKTKTIQLILSIPLILTRLRQKNKFYSKSFLLYICHTIIYRINKKIKALKSNNISL